MLTALHRTIVDTLRGRIHGNIVRRACAVICAAMLVAGWFSVPATATAAKNVTRKVDRANERFQVKTQVGLDGMVLYDTPALVKVTVECSENFTGSVRLYPMQDYRNKVIAYGSDIALAAGQAKTFSFVLQDLGGNGMVKVEILNEKDQVVYGETDTVVMTGTDEKVLAGVLSDDYSALNYFDGIPFPLNSNTEKISLLQVFEEDLDGDSTALAALSFLVIDNFDTAGLTEEQYSVLQDWVSNGGILILSLGANCQNVLHGLQGRLFDAQTGSLVKKTVTYSVNQKMLEGEGFLLPGVNGIGSLSDGQEDTQDPDDGQEDDGNGAANGQTDEAEPDGQGDDTDSQETTEEEADGAESEKQGNDTDGNGQADEAESDGQEDVPPEEPETVDGIPEGKEDALQKLWSGGRLSVTDVDEVALTVENGEPLTGFSPDGDVWMQRVGAGAVVLVPFALGMEPIATYYPERGVMAEALLTSIGLAAGGVGYNSGAANQGGYMLYSGEGELLAKLADVAKKPSVILYGGLLMLYVVIVGPVLYLVLKARKKREQIWVAIPVTAMIFTGIIYLTGFLYRVRIPIVNTFTLVTAGDHVQKEDVYANVVTPRAKDSSILIDPSFARVRPNDDYSYNLFSSFGNEDSETDFDYMIRKTNDGTELLFHNQKAFSENSFSVSRSSENQTGQLTLDVSCSTTGFEGTVTNNTKYDLKNVVVNFERFFYSVGDLKTGESVKLDPVDMIDAASAGRYVDLVYDSWNSQLGREKSRNYSVDSAICNCLARNEAYNAGCAWGIIEHYDSGLCSGSSVKKNGYGVIFQQFEAEYDDMTGVYYPDLRDMIVSDQGDYDSSDGMMYAGDVTITYSFENCPGVTSLEMISSEDALMNQRGYGSLAEVYAYNAETGEYEPIFENERILSGEKLRKYMLGDILMLKYHTDDVYEGFIPRIAARGDE